MPHPEPAPRKITAHSWIELARRKVITDVWLSQQLRLYDIRPRTFRIDGAILKSYLREDFQTDV